MPTYTAYGRPNPGWWSRPRQRTCLIAIISSGLTQDHGGGIRRSALNWMNEATKNLTFLPPRNSLSTSRIKPLPNWPDSDKIKQLYTGNTTQGDEMTLGSAMSDKVMHFRRSSKLERKDLIVPPLPFALIGKAICAGWIFRRDKGTRRGFYQRSRYLHEACMTQFMISTVWRFIPPLK